MESDLGARQERERDFHDRWAAEVDPERLDPETVATCPTTPETIHALALLGDPSGKQVLEIGCGHGELTTWLALRGARVTTRDISPRMIEIGRRVARRFGVEASITFHVGPGEALPYPDAAFDIAFGHDVLHHMDLGRAMPEIHRVLRSGGAAIFAEPLGHNPILNHFRDQSPETRTPDEKPLVFSDFDTIRRGFASFSHREFHLCTMALFLWFRWVEGLDPNKVRYWKKMIEEAARYRWRFAFLHAMDRLLLGVFPQARRWCRMTVIALRK